MITVGNSIRLKWFRIFMKISQFTVPALVIGLMHMVIKSLNVEGF